MKRDAALESALERAIDEIAKAMGDEIKRRAHRLHNDMTEDERDKLIDHAQCIRSAKTLCLAGLNCKESDLLFMEFGCEAIKGEVKSLRKIRNQYR